MQNHTHSFMVRYRRQDLGARVALVLAAAALALPLVVDTALAQNVPTGGSVAAGSVFIARPSAFQLNVFQSSQSAVVNWQGFSVGQGNAVNFIQPNSSSAILNRVTGSAPSTIAGSITANGQVYLVNPNGIAITSSGTVNTGGGFVASTLGISDGNFMSGNRTFTGNGASAGVSNAGTISVGRGGYAALIGGTVSNSGNIMVPLGKVGLGSGEMVTLDFAGDGFLQVAMPTAAGGKGALIRNSGSIKADGGSVVISAATAREAARNAVNISGVVEARSIGGHSGAITIGGGEGGNVKVSGKLTATSRHAKGGDITVTGNDIKLRGATVDASGRTGGGTVRIGGDLHGGGTLQQASSVSVDAATTIHSDATVQGAGGEVVLWSAGTTGFQGLITATGGPKGGNGGRVEVSGLLDLNYAGTVDTRAPHGEIGSLLLDPEDVTIQTAAGTPNVPCTSGTCTPSGDDSVLTVATLQAALALSSVTVNTGSSGAQAGHITVSNAVTWNSGFSLTLNAAAGITVSSGASITATNGGSISMTAAAGGISITSATISTVGTGNLNLSAPTAGAANAITLNNATLSLGTGTGTISGTTSTVRGISFLGSNSLTATSGSFSVSGTATSGTGIGISLGTGASLTTSGSVTLTATSSSGTGLNLGANSTTTDSAGNLTINASSSSAIGAQINSQVGLVNSGAGSFNFNASTSASALNSSALFFATGGSLTSSGAITIGATSTSLKGIAITLSGTNAIIDSGGNLTINASNSATGFSAVNVNGAQSFTNSGTGSFNFNATTTGGQNGINFASGASLTTSGALTLAATATTGAGVFFTGSNTVTDSAGNLAITGGNSTTTGLGISGNGALSFVNSGAGTFALSGTSASATGVAVASGASLTTSGSVTLTAASSSGTGLTLANNSTITDSAGNLTINAGSSSATGAQIAGQATLANSGTGSFNFNANTGASVLNTSALYLATGASLTSSGAITIGAISTGGDAAVTFAGANTVTDSSGNLTINASNFSNAIYSAGDFYGAQTFTNSGAGSFNFNAAQTGGQNGINFASGATLTSSGTLTFAATAAGGAGVNFAGSNTITDSAGNLAITGGATTGEGIYGTAALSFVNAGAGTFALSGTSSATYGVQVAGGSTFATTTSGTGAVNIAGVGAGTNGDINIATAGAITLGAGTIAGSANGVSITSSAGAVNLTGTSVAAGNGALLMAAGANSSFTLNAGAVLSSSATGSAVTVDAGGNFVNSSGADAISTGTGRWLVFSSSPGADTFGNLNSGNTAIWNTAAGASISATGNRYVFTYQPTLTFTSTSDTKVYGQNNAGALASDFIVSGYSPGVSGAFLADSAATAYSGAPAVTSSGSAVTATVAGGPYAINIGQGALSSASGYGFAFANPGQLTVTPASLTVTATDQSKVYGTTANLGTTSFTTWGLVGSDSVSGVTLSSPGSVATAGVNGGTPYALYASGAVGSGLSNYNIHYVVGGLTVTPAWLVLTGVTAQDKVYDATTAASVTGGSLSGLVNGDSVTLSSANASFARANVGTGIGVTTRYTLSGAGAGNYMLAQPTGLWANITPASLTVTATDQSKIYGTTANLGTTGFTAWGLLGSDRVSGVTLSSPGSVATAGVNGGTPYALYASGAVGSGLSNYTIHYVAGGLTVSPAWLVLTGVTALDKVFDTTTSASVTGGSLWGIVNGDSVTLSSANANFDSPNVGYGIGVTTDYTLSGVDAGNYRLVQPRGLRANITPLKVARPPLPPTFPQPPVVEPQPPVLEPQPPVSEPQPVASEPQPVAANVNPPLASPGTAAGCAGGTGDPFASNGNGSSGGPSSSCGANAAPKVISTPAEIIDFGISKPNLGALSKAVEKQFAAMKDPTVAIKLAAGMSLAATVGLIAWLLRGGALLTALLSSMPLWRQFDPLAIVLRPRRRDDKRDDNDDEISSHVDHMFKT